MPWCKGCALVHASRMQERRIPFRDFFSCGTRKVRPYAGFSRYCASSFAQFSMPRRTTIS